MRRLFPLLLICSTGYGQLTIEAAQVTSRQFHVSSYSDHEQFIGHKGFGAPLILTNDGGAAVFGDGDEGSMLIKFDKAGKVQWKRSVPPKGTEMELQSVVQDKNGDYMVFILVHDETKYRGGCERAIFINKQGAIVWDKFIGSCAQVNNPIVSYIKALPDGRILLRGHVVLKAPPEGQDPTYNFWEGWISNKGVLTQKSGVVIDWAKTEEWQSRLKPD